MTPRERLAPQAVTEPVPRPGPALAVRTPPADPPHPATWDELYHSAAPQQQLELLAAARAGVIHAHHLPHLLGNVLTGEPRSFLTHLLAGNLAGLTSVTPAPLAWVDSSLDEAQRDAAARALASPDVFLLQGMPGTGKSRVVSEVITQAALRSERVLLLAPTPAGLDRVLEEIGARDAVLALRCLARHERVDDLSATVRGLTLAERLRRLADESLPAARRAGTAAAERHQNAASDLRLLQELAALADQRADLGRQVAALTRQRDEVPAQVEAEATSTTTAEAFPTALRALTAEHAAARQRIEAAQADVAQQIAKEHVRQKELEPDLARVSPLAEAKRQGRWWSSAWWQATLGSGDPLGQLADLEKRGRDCETALADLEQRRAQLADELTQADAACQERRKQLCDTECARRQADIQERLTALTEATKAAAERWNATTGQLSPACAAPPPEAITPAVVAAQDRVQQAAEQAAFASDWAQTLADSLAQWPQRLLSQANVVAATLGGLPADEHFGSSDGFDLLVVEDAHLAGETELLAAARRARRCLLVGESDWLGAAPEPLRRAGVPDAPRPFGRLWQTLHGDPRRLPAVWVQEDGRWCCRLHGVAPEQRAHLESEPVADCAEVELRILVLPHQQPVLAEVMFPAAMSIVQAKQYIFGELQELPVQAGGDSFRWTENADRIILRLSDASLAGTAAVTLAAGVRELISVAATHGEATRPGHTCCIEFDRQAGWDRARAGAWVNRHLGVRDLGRTARLSAPHRMQPELAAVVADLFAGYPCRSGDANAAGGAVVEFVAVPTLSAPEPARPANDQRRAENGRRTATLAPPRPVRGGAGLEIDLSEPRQRERLPEGVRGLLPARGLVNLAEAQAVVAYLEALVRQANGCGTPSIGVMALYPAQADLIRWLIRQSPVLHTGLELRVGLPAAFAQREAAVALVSLTRSHGHRAVAFGDGPSSLALALTRARSRLVLFGDVGTLVRRGQWETAVDHLDEQAAGRERELVRRLLRYVHGQGTHGRAFQLRESLCP